MDGSSSLSLSDRQNDRVASRTYTDTDLPNILLTLFPTAQMGCNKIDNSKCLYETLLWKISPRQQET